MQSITLNRGQDEYLPIKLKAEWMGNPKGTKLVLHKAIAQQLVDRKAAKLLDNVPGTEKEEKALKNPVKDKMLRGPKRQKMTRTRAK